MSVVSVKVPATTANLGPGFDCLGVALKVYNVVKITKAKRAPDGMIGAAGKAFFKAARKAAFGFACEISGDVPRSRGMGSSVTVRLGVLHGLNRLAGSPLSAERIFEICSELEGHPDNAAPAAFGGFTIARMGLPVQRYKVSEKLGFALLIPNFEMETAAARRVLPAKVSLHDAVVSAGNASAIAGAFASKDYEKLAGCFDDRLHQPYREKLIPFLSKVTEAGRKAGALGGWLSGSGSTIACVTLGSAERVGRAMMAASGLREAKIITTQADNTGVRISVRS